MSHIENVIVKRNKKVVLDSRLRLKTSIDAIRWLTFQACAFRGHDESAKSMNQGNFLEMIKILASYNNSVKEVVLENAPKNAKYTSSTVQKEILHTFAHEVQKTIREDIGNSKFCLIVDESRDASKKEQMGIVVRFVDKEGFIRGQGYDEASNMRGEWNGLQALILKEYPYAYYVHCMAHQLQLALIAASREVYKVHNFFQNAIFIINVVSVSAKRNDELLKNQAEEIVRAVELGELESGRGANQIGALQRPTDTTWSSHYNSICSLARMFGATVSVLRSLAPDRSLSPYSRGDAVASLEKLLSFEFVFVMHLMIEITAITNTLCQALQDKSLDILNALSLVSSTKMFIQKLRDNGWEPLLEKVNSFCHKYEIELPDMSCRAREGSTEMPIATLCV
ncbi:zinc finger MYM-type-like protein [Rhynchospora pubera]|uniref:Zinc finger MYM-type-like protein n=1 Tax=Rhynchospora pubera TaxID=906938 RepID=A0AAV8GV41_9POAL|nr:zinc finger MYM-type-like protein [Rhynchospora pubera]